MKGVGDTEPAAYTSGLVVLIYPQHRRFRPLTPFHPTAYSTVRQQLIMASRWLAISAATSATAFAATSPVPQDAPLVNPVGAEDAQDPKPKKQQIVVTAQKQGAEAVQDVPRSVTAISQKQIRDAGLTSIADAARFVPNALVTGFSARRLSFPYVRGVGSGQGDPAVATFVDGVPQLSVSSTNLSFAGLDRVEILRGPSSVLWGRNTIGGAINMISRKPSWDPGGEFQTSFGNYNSTRYQVRATGPVTDETLAMSVDASYEKRDGYTDNVATGNDVGDAESTFARMQFLWAPNENNTVHFSVYGEASRDGGFVLSSINDRLVQPGQPVLPGLRTNPFRINQDFEGSTERDILAGSIVWNHYGNDFEFVSITAAQGWDIDESADFDFSFFSPFGLDDAIRRYTNEEETYAYQEFRLSSPADSELDAGRKDGVKWLIGTSAFYSDSKREASNEYRPGSSVFTGLPAEGVDRNFGTFYSWSASVFGQSTFVFANGFEATAALRYDYESRDARLNHTFAGNQVPGGMQQLDRSFERLLPRGSIAYRFCDDFKSYFSVARGFKAGGFNLTAPMGSESFGTETSWTYELGAKTQWFDDRLTANAAIFFVDWDDMQCGQVDKPRSRTRTCWPDQQGLDGLRHGWLSRHRVWPRLRSKRQRARQQPAIRTKDDVWRRDPVFTQTRQRPRHLRPHRLVPRRRVLLRRERRGNRALQLDQPARRLHFEGCSTRRLRRQPAR
jgi:iron complex outermembrane receptor protein